MEKREAQDIFAKMTKEELYDDNQNLFKKIDIQYKQLTISNNVIEKLKNDNIILNKEIVNLKNTLSDYKDSNNKLQKELYKEKENNIELLEQVNILKGVIEKNNYDVKIKELEKQAIENNSIKSSITDTHIFDNSKKVPENTVYSKQIPAWKIAEEEDNKEFPCKNECCIDFVNTENIYCDECILYVKLCKDCNTEYSDAYSNSKKCFDCRNEMEEEDNERVNFKDDEANTDSSISDYENDNESNEKMVKQAIDKENKNKTNIINKESSKLLNRIKNIYYNFNHGFLPKINNLDIYENYKIINNGIINMKKIHIETIIQYSNIYEKFINSNSKINNRIFSEYIEYNKDIYNIKYYEINNFYGKVKKCYDFINYFISKDFNEDTIIDNLYKLDLTYTKLYKIKKTDYQDLKNFFFNVLSENKKTA